MAKKIEENRLKTDASMVFNHIFDVSGTRGYKKFLFFLIMIDLTWFASVALDNLFGLNFQDYGEFAWILLFSLGMIIISDVKKIISMGRKGIRSDNFSSLVTFVIGMMALIVAILSLPQINIASPIMSSIKGIIAVIAVFYVIIEAFVVEND
jgi:hypothetical protein